MENKNNFHAWCFALITLPNLLQNKNQIPIQSDVSNIDINSIVWLIHRKKNAALFNVDDSCGVTKYFGITAIKIYKYISG